MYYGTKKKKTFIDLPSISKLSHSGDNNRGDEDLINTLHGEATCRRIDIISEITEKYIYHRLLIVVCSLPFCDGRRGVAVP
jgi:hypothetical protein